MMTELTKVTSKGQVVIPSKIRKELDIEEGSQMAVSKIGDFVLMKKAKIEDPKEEFKSLTGWGTRFAKRKGIRTEQDVVDIIHKGRRK